jgi:hypothetical protein
MSVTAPSCATVVAPSVTPAAATPVAVIPGAGADEDSTYKPIRSVIAIGRARIWVIVVVSIVADWRGANVARTKSNAHADLSL